MSPDVTPSKARFSYLSQDSSTEHPSLLRDRAGSENSSLEMGLCQMEMGQEG